MLATEIGRGPQPGFSPSAGLRLAGSASVALWGSLAWRSHAGGGPLGVTLATMALAWAALACAWRWASWRDSREILFFGLGFRLIAFVAVPVMEDDHHRFLWDGYRFAATGDPYAKPPQARFGDDTVPAEFRAVLDRINHPDVPTIYGPLTEWAFRLSHAIAPARLARWYRGYRAGRAE